MAAADMAFDLDQDDDDQPSAPVHFLAPDDGDPADIVAEADARADSMQQLTTAFGELDDRSRDIVQRRWLAEQKATLHELAGEYGVSAERIRQLENNAMKKLKKAIPA